MSDSRKLHYIVHVAPQNLRFTETHLADPGEDLFYPPVWVVRPECARDRSALVYGWSVIGGAVKSHADPHNPLPDTDGHGWAYIECDTLLVKVTRDESSDAWKDAAYLFTGVCSPIAESSPFDPAHTQWSPATYPSVSDDTSDAAELYRPEPSDIDDHGSTYHG